MKRQKKVKRNEWRKGRTGSELTFRGLMWGQHDEAVMEVRLGVCGRERKMYGWLTEERKTESEYSGR